MLEGLIYVLAAILGLGGLTLALFHFGVIGAHNDPHGWEDGDLEPLTEREAVSWGYCGQRCPDCHSYRLKRQVATHACDSCKVTFPSLG